MTATPGMPIQVVPHFPRLQEWIALEEGYFRDEGLAPELLAGVMHAVSSHQGDAYGRRPQDLPFVRGAPVANSACEWGTACNAGAGMGRLVPDLYSVGRYAIFTRPGSPLQRLAELRDVPVGVGLMAGSHFTALAALAQALPRERISVVHTGGPGRRLLALLAGDYDYRTFGPGEQLVFEPYTEEMFREALDFARRWGLDSQVREDRYAHLLAPVGP